VVLPVCGSTWGWRHWAQISFIMHCIGLLMEPIARCVGFRYRCRTPCRAAATAAIIWSEPMAMIRSVALNAIAWAPRAPEA